MQFSLKLSELRKIVKTFRLVISHDCKYILDYLKFTPSGINKLLVIGGEGLTEIELKVKASIYTLSEILFKFENIKELLHILKDNKENSEITFKSSSSTHSICEVYLLEELIYSIRTKEALDYPEYKYVKFTNSNSFNIDINKLQEVFSKVAKMSSPDETKHILQGIHFKGYNNILECTATDGHRLNILNLKKVNFEEPINITIKFKTLSLVSHLMKGNIKVFISDNKEFTVFEDANTRITSMIQLGEYPDYLRLIPNYLDSLRLVVTFDKKTLLWNLKTAVENNLVILDISHNTADLKITEANSIKTILYHNVIDCQSTITYKIGFNHKYFRDAILNIKLETVTISLDPNNQKGVLFNQDNLTQLVMPTWLIY